MSGVKDSSKSYLILAKKNIRIVGEKCSNVSQLSIFACTRETESAGKEPLNICKWKKERMRQEQSRATEINFPKLWLNLLNIKTN